MRVWGLCDDPASLTRTPRASFLDGNPTGPRREFHFLRFFFSTFPRDKPPGYQVCDQLGEVLLWPTRPVRRQQPLCMDALPSVGCCHAQSVTGTRSAPSQTRGGVGVAQQV